MYADRKTHDRDERIETYTYKDYPKELQKKVTLL